MTIRLVFDRSTSFFASLVAIIAAIFLCRQFFEHQKSSQSECSRKASFEDGWVNLGSVELRPVNFKSAMRVLGKSSFVRRRASGKINVVGLGHQSRNGAWGGMDLLAVKANP